MPLLKQKWITRADLQANPTWWYCFGDNLQRIGRGGQAKEMRGEPNAIGIATKASPWEYLNDNIHFYLAAQEFAHVFNQIDTFLAFGDTVVFPEDGFGTGLADLATRAPMINDLLCVHLRWIEARALYWPTERGGN
jgi:hypothetical protein